MNILFVSGIATLVILVLIALGLAIAVYVKESNRPVNGSFTIESDSEPAPTTPTTPTTLTTPVPVTIAPPSAPVPIPTPVPAPSTSITTAPCKDFVAGKTSEECFEHIWKQSCTKPLSAAKKANHGGKSVWSLLPDQLNYFNVNKKSYDDIKKSITGFWVNQTYDGKNICT